MIKLKSSIITLQSTTITAFYMIIIHQPKLLIQTQFLTEPIMQKKKQQQAKTYGVATLTGTQIKQQFNKAYRQYFKQQIHYNVLIFSAVDKHRNVLKRSNTSTNIKTAIHSIQISHDKNNKTSSIFKGLHISWNKKRASLSLDFTKHLEFLVQIQTLVQFHAQITRTS